MNQLFAQLALDWLDAERAADPVRWPNATPKRDDMTVAIDRVYQVITGNVLWSEASPGDKAIWKSRVEDIPTFARSWHRSGKARDEGDQTVEDPFNQTTPRPTRPGRIPVRRSRVWWNYYDTLHVTDDGPISTKLFGNMNVGNIFLTNLQVAGQIRPDAVFSVHRMYVAISSLEALHWAADKTVFTFILGSRPGVPLFLRDLFRGVDISDEPIAIPVRQNFAAQVDFRHHPRECPVLPFDLTYHFEGYETRDVQ